MRKKDHARRVGSGGHAGTPDLRGCSLAAAGGHTTRDLSARNPGAAGPPANTGSRPARNAARRPPARARPDALYRRPRLSRACSTRRSSAQASPAARIKSIDTRAAEAMPGVMAVLLGREIPVNSFGPSLKDQPVLADERVYHAGDGVAAVAAVTEQIALEALDKIKVEYEPLPAVFDPLEAMTRRRAQSACAEQQHLRDQGHQERRRRQGLRRVRPHLRRQLPHPDGRARADGAALRRSRCGTPTAASPSTRRSAASRSAAPTSRAR